MLRQTYESLNDRVRGIFQTRTTNKPHTKLTRAQVLRRGGVTVLVLLILVWQMNGPVGAWTADRLRAILGPAATAQIEAWYLGATDTVTQVRYHLPGQSVAPPYQAAQAPHGTATPTPSATPTIQPMRLQAIQPIITPALAGEGQWVPVTTVAGQGFSVPIIAKTYIRPDPQRTYAIASLLQIDTRFTTLHLVAGTQEPGGSLGKHGPGVIPSADQAPNLLVAAFNGGFKYADGHYGLMADGTVYVPPVAGTATIAMTREGKVFIGAWGVDPRLTLANTDLVAWRQNAALLIDNGVLNPLTNDGRAWGGTVLNSTYTWRSGIGVTADGSLIYAGGNSLSAATLGKALLAGGAVMALQTDINPFWVRAFTYSTSSTGTLHATKLASGMQGTGMEYLHPNARDFFYLTQNALP